MSKLPTLFAVAILCPLWMPGSAASGQADDGNEKPNILLIIADDLGYADMSFLSNSAPDVHTPNIDRLGKEGFYFTDAYSTSPICSPSRAGLISGMYQARWGNYWYGEGGLPDSVTTLPERLQKAGYITKKIGKTHLNGGPVEHPLEHGFDRFLGFIDHTWDYLRLSQQDVEEYGPENARRAHIGPLTRDHKKVSYNNDFTTDIFSREAVNFINRDRDRPFYLHLSYNAVHHPTYVGHPEYLDDFGIEQFPFWDPQKETYRSWHAKWGHLGKVDPNGRTRYLLQLAVMDDGIGRILDALEENGLRSGTCIIFTSDNGGTINTYSKNDPLNGYKYMFGEGGIRVPLVINCPGNVGGQRISPLVSAMDIYPTILELANREIPDNLDGRSLVPYLQDKKPYTAHKQLVWSNGRDSWVVRKGRWKLVHNIGWSHSSFVLEQGKALRAGERYRYPGGIRLYDLENDIDESRDLSDEKPDLVEELSSIYNDWRNSMSEPRRGNGTVKPGPEKGEKLGWGVHEIVENTYANSSDINHYANLVTDDFPGTYWQSVTGNAALPLPHHITIKLKKTVRIGGFKYLPNQHATKGRVDNYTFSVSTNGERWQKIKTGKWDNTAELKEVLLHDPVPAKFVRLGVQSAHNSKNSATIAEIGLVVK
ncbi:MAG: sulfatase-like hydrolase/transferase [Balneolaceae bacterium]|nr:sulfatase-like hydrolase/transferase [Balneolaceae bacterium]